jgi:hypothetical protein
VSKKPRDEGGTAVKLQESVADLARRFLQFRSHCVAFTRHIQLGKYIKGGSQLFPLRLTITLFARKKAPLPVAISQIAPRAQFQAERFPLLNNAKGNFQFADSPAGSEAMVSQRRSAAALTLLPQMLHSRNHLRQALAALPPVPFPIGKLRLQDHGVSCLQFPKWSKLPQLLPQQGVQLEMLTVAIQHPQQRRIDKTVSKRTAQTLVEEQKQQSDLEAFTGQAVGIS